MHRSSIKDFLFLSLPESLPKLIKLHLQQHLTIVGETETAILIETTKSQGRLFLSLSAAK